MLRAPSKLLKQFGHILDEQVKNETVSLDAVGLKEHFSELKTRLLPEEIFFLDDSDIDWMNSSPDGIPIRLNQFQNYATKINSLLTTLPNETTPYYAWKRMIGLATNLELQSDPPLTDLFQYHGIASQTPSGSWMMHDRLLRTTIRAFVAPSERGLRELRRLGLTNYQDEDVRTLYESYAFDKTPDSSSKEDADIDWKSFNQQRIERKVFFERELVEWGWDPESEDYKLTMRCYDLADEAHARHARASGDPYILHPSGAALIAIRLGSKDPYLIGTTLLHDAVEDQPGRIMELLGHLAGSYELTGDRDKDCKLLINRYLQNSIGTNVLKLTKPPYPKGDKAAKKEAEKIYEVRLNQEEDALVLLVKGLDRLHNLRTIAGLPFTKYSVQAIETAVFVLPLLKKIVDGKISATPEQLKLAKDIYHLLTVEVVELSKEWALRMPEFLEGRLQKVRAQYIEMHSAYEPDQPLSDLDESVAEDLDQEMISDVTDSAYHRFLELASQADPVLYAQINEALGSAHHILHS